jgi:hypothetical protein
MRQRVPDATDPGYIRDGNREMNTLNLIENIERIERNVIDEYKDTMNRLALAHIKDFFLMIPTSMLGKNSSGNGGDDE